MLEYDAEKGVISGPAGSLSVKPDDEILSKLAMLIEGECGGLGARAAAAKYGFSRARYYQLLKAAREQGSSGLLSHKRGPKRPHRSTEEVVRQIIRHRYLDPEASAEVIRQKLVQCGVNVSARTVLRVLERFGLQKKTLPARSH